MQENFPNWFNLLDVYQNALSRWETEGGALPGDPASNAAPKLSRSRLPPLRDTELLHLRKRIIALENLVVSLLALAPQHQLTLSRQIATYIRPRPGFTCHPLTLDASLLMQHLISRASAMLSAPHSTNSGHLADRKGKFR